MSVLILLPVVHDPLHNRGAPAIVKQQLLLMPSLISDIASTFRARFPPTRMPSVGGWGLVGARRALPADAKGQRIPTGTAVVTSGRFGRLKVDHVIHATG